MPNRSGGRKIYGWSTRQQGGFRKTGGPVKTVNPAPLKQTAESADWLKPKKTETKSPFRYRDIEIDSKKFHSLLMSGDIDITCLNIKSLFNEVNDEELKISQVMQNFFVTDNNTKITFDWLTLPNRVVVLEGNDTSKMVVEKTKTEAEKRDEKIKHLADEYGLPYNIIKIIPKKELGIFLRIFGNNACSPFDRRSAFSTSKKFGLHQHAVTGFEKNLKLVEHLDNHPDPLGRMHLTYLFRHTGRLRECIKCSNVVEYERKRFPADDKILAIICTIRAACFLDIFDFHQDEDLLVMARKTINKAYAVSKNVKESSEQISLVYQRLEKLKGEVLRTKFKRKVNDGYGRWSDWLR